jgi:acetate kinase
LKILVLNCGSSTVRFEIIETSPEQIQSNSDRLLARGRVERIGSADALLRFDAGGITRRVSQAILNHDEALQAACECLIGPDGVIAGPCEIEGVGHRVVHGGEEFAHSRLIDAMVLHEIEKAIDLAPLHNPQNLKGYRAAVRLFPNAPQVAVFDTSFHCSLPPAAYLYGLPYVHYTRDQIRRYGFHGTSHRYISYRFAQIHGKRRADYKLISSHLGHGCSVCAIDHGRSVDTSMGYTPMEGLIMGTRPGDVDAGAILHLAGRQELGLHEIDVLLNKHSGLYGISGLSGDMRELLEAEAKGDQRASLAIDAFCYRVKKYFGAYLAALNGADAILFGGGIGENSPAVRARICSGLEALGVELDATRNAGAIGLEAEISVPGSKVAVWVVPTNEELLIARDTLRCILGLPLP